MKKKGTSEALLRSVMNQCEVMKTSVDCDLSKEFKVKVWMYQVSVLSPFPFITELARQGVLTELLYGHISSLDEWENWGTWK